MFILGGLAELAENNARYCEDSLWDTIGMQNPEMLPLFETPLDDQ